MMPFVLVGLPGTGKTTISEMLGKKYNMPVVSTDTSILRQACHDVSNPVTKQFIENFERNYGCKLSNPELLRDYTEFSRLYGAKPYCDLEEQAILKAFADGVMDGAIVDLSGAAFVREAVRNVLSEHAVVSIYLEASDAHIVKNLYDDHVQSLLTDNIKRKRHFDAAVAAEENGKGTIAGLSELNAHLRNERTLHYRKASHTIKVDDGDTPEMVMVKVEKLLCGLRQQPRPKTLNNKPPGCAP